MNKMFAIIEIGSNNTKTHIYKNEELIYEKTDTIEFKKNYKNENKITENDLNKLYEVIKNVLNYTKNINIYGCSIFRNISKEELDEINKKLSDKFDLKIQVVSQEDEANYTALGCYNNPKWFDGSRAMKVITNLISHKIDAKYIIPTKINMEDGLKMQKMEE